MRKEVGLWIDHKQAIIVTAANDGGDLKCIESNVEKDVRHTGRAGAKSVAAPLAEDHRDRKLIEHLNKYYDEILSYLRDADAILILGPGEAKLELERRLKHAEASHRLVGVETADKMTKAQIKAKVRNFFVHH